MKDQNILKAVFLIITTMMMSAFRSDAQTLATTSVAANVIAPISIIKNMDMNFGNAAVSTVVGGTVVLSPAGTRTTSGGGVTLPATSGTVNAASFTVSGAPTYTYAITLPGSVAIVGPGAATMTVNGFSSIPAATGTLNISGTQTISVGAVLTIAAAQTPGTYTNPTAIPVTVNYN